MTAAAQDIVCALGPTDGAYARIAIDGMRSMIRAEWNRSAAGMVPA